MGAGSKEPTMTPLYTPIGGEKQKGEHRVGVEWKDQMSEWTDPEVLKSRITAMGALSKDEGLPSGKGPGQQVGIQ